MVVPRTMESSMTTRRLPSMLSRSGLELHAHAHGTQLLRRLDKRTAHIAILDEALAKGNAALVRITLRRRQAGVGHADDQVGLDGLLINCQLTTHVITTG